MRRAPVPVLILTLAALAAPAAARAEDPVAPTLGVQGQGEVELAPDVGSFEAGVRRVAATSAGARGAANARLATIVRRLRALQVPRADITTTSVSLSRQRYRGAKTGRIRVRWVASGSFSVRVVDVARVGPALDAVAAAGATGVEGPSFSFSPGRRTDGRLAAEQAALGDARRRADAAAASQGQRVIGVRSIDLDPSSSVSFDDARESATPTSDSSSASAESAAPTPVLAGRSTFSSTVRVVYLLGPAG
ncbi:SIMPL domain-containing protein [Patulibacter sp. NPDC049589]|uniref:SIMPL domain-containing protein n=1 Tax=Patulibacter sp. NPDC049589 TaxID=3154731 RepID=UPI003435E131